MCQVTHDVFDEHDRTVHDQAEVERPEAEQTAGDGEPPHAAEREQHRQRDRQRDDQPRPQVAEEQEQDGDDEQPALEQVAPHGVDDPVHQVRPRVDGLDVDAGRQVLPGLVELLL